MTELPKTFDPAEIESRWYAHWEEKGLFRPERPDAEPFTIVNPPPNVTGSLHIGHALDNTLQDIAIRYERLRGKDALWVVGTDHAGIATQMVVERQMEARQDKRTNYTREQFIEKVWEWKAESGGAITRQLRRLGCSMDWANERFTMDEGFSKAVIKVFVELHRRGLLYRDKRLVNWDPRFRSAISDLEVETQEVKGGFWHFRYPLADGVRLANGADHIVVATTRPETMLADMAVAVHPEDPRYRDVIGKDILQPITGRRFKVVADEHADPELGSGAVKITPGHDFNDFEVGKRAGFRPAEMLNMFDADANVVQTADGLIPERFLGLHRFRNDGVDGARELVVAEMKALGLLVPHVTRNKEGEEVVTDAEPRTIQTPFGDRSGVVIEPWLTDQWYVDAQKLAVAPMQAVRDGRIEIVPKTWEKTFFNWMENIQPWCVSRQLWWGHRIPAWYDEDGNPYVAESEEEAQALAGNKGLTRDPDVLDTWFSSALWPFGTLGWPEETETLKRHYPNDLLISGFDILFFWDARMAMMGMEFMGPERSDPREKVPWRKLYLHGLVRAADGQKMSKSKGNVVDPLGLIDRFGADALRFFMAAMESQGRDVKMDEKRVEGYRNFATKLWNAARFLQSNGVTASTSHEAPHAEAPVNRWIVAETVATVQAIDTAMAELRFDAAANAIYHFIWDQFCDWYIELTKGSMDEETRAVAGWAFDQILVMLHPFMPFITEELWNLTGTREGELIVARWPQALYAVDGEAQAEIDWLIRLIGAMRTARTELNVPPGAKLGVVVHDASEETRRRIDRQGAALARLGRVESLSFGDSVTGGAAQIVVDEATFILPLEGVIDIAAEKARLAKALAAAEKERDSLSARLSNPSFVEKAKPEAVAKAREDHGEKAAEAERLKAALERLA
ncbi:MULTISPECIES: valine--tRNA ligase [Sphingobium]|uniref:Valine--tRNA ligase n=1 Tax=Sphingobium fuliginis (strain ATCC 27551) TaxID=336203 RepID=A0ABQ1ERG0_SPHSA|nr:MULTISPECIES: valine--tRNA ligase [Sphingobium]AJR24764.1 valyl-tRNA synthetase [Sphingobium sp. YBL2]RYL99330.1 valine--tRNA ligase [Sphingobium fuliginis]WDA36853.1 valine--tRNA ligase [Sphingobium sp. YC-XJ3]GFZ84078.1 valine--tRNA ligase [Sphingobium fuliginis]